MNERLVRLTIGNAVDDAYAIRPYSMEFIEGYVWGVLTNTLAGVQHDMVIAGVDNTLMVWIQWTPDSEFISYPFVIDPGLLKTG